MSEPRSLPPLPFYVQPARTGPGSVRGAYLISDAWNDYGYVTMFRLIIRHDGGNWSDIGQVKIGQFGMQPDQQSPMLNNAFYNLEGAFFSLGQDANYYEALRDLGTDLRVSTLTALRDIAYDKSLYQLALREQVTVTSLLRSISPKTVEDQFHRIARGGATATPFHFAYNLPGASDLTLPFNIAPASYPPTNIHALIGSNGVGKTRLLRNLALSVADESNESSKVGEVFNLLDDTEPVFANLISVSFSAFDSLIRVEPRSVPHAYVSLSSDSGKEASPPGSRRSLSREFAAVVDSLNGERDARWKKALETLGSDPIFSEMDIYNNLRPQPSSPFEVVPRPNAARLFDNLSAGHKIVLLAITRLADLVSERTLVLIDEPETHLHPPLLSAFIRSLSELLIDRNGVAIVATHSPVVLQETPKSCVWKLRRSGDSTSAERPTIETFGENVGVLTREIFGLEVTRSGFHKILEEAVRTGATFMEVMGQFSGQLGGEASGLLRVLIAERDRQNRSSF